MEFTQVLRLRRSVRAFLPDAVPEDDLQAVLDAAQLAPIAGGDYAMSHITVVTDPALLSGIRTACLLHRKDGTAVDPLYGAPVLILLSATGPSDDGIEYCNVACAIENMMLAAVDRGLGSVYLWGFLRKLRAHPEVIARLHLPEGYTILSGLAVGHAKTEPALRTPAAHIAVDRL